jgi:hypothetical protein
MNLLPYSVSRVLFCRVTEKLPITASGRSNNGPSEGSRVREVGIMDAQAVAWYTQGALTGMRLQAAIDEAARTLSSDNAGFSKLGLNDTDLREVRFIVQEEGGFIAEGIILAIAIGAGGNISADAAKALWRAVLKRVKDKHGDDAVGPEQTAQNSDSAATG